MKKTRGRKSHATVPLNEGNSITICKQIAACLVYVIGFTINVINVINGIPNRNELNNLGELVYFLHTDIFTPEKV